MPLGLPTSDGCGKDLALLPVLGEYRNVLGEELPDGESRVGDRQDELGRSEPMLGEELRGLGALNEGRDGVVWKDLDGAETLGLGPDRDGAEILGLGPDRDGAEMLGLGPDRDGLPKEEGLRQLGLEPLEGLRQLGLEPIEGLDRLDPMDGPGFLEDDRCCILDDRSDLSRAATELPNVRVVWDPNRLLAVGEISTAAVITTAAARHLFFFSVNILLLLLPLCPDKTPVKLHGTDQQPAST